ncbi:hypothetical protein HORIV_64680 [Vreelandella olivaria]|uniref:Carbohydrate kinase PfkB domain-containing protein n=1 Tax=Vreelandella olivaria TaxID=390919 RepID=A0ABM7GT66_9GAMM|nr:hypothetical protein HORIV_64680 [Halomonas olivaria]
MASFAKYLGGSSGNMAYGTARLGLKSAMLSRVGNEQMGNFVREELARVGWIPPRYKLILSAIPVWCCWR